MITLCVILGRAGSKGLKNKNSKLLQGKPMIAWTLDHALQSQVVDDVVVSTDCPEIIAYCENKKIEVIHRPHHLAGDKATVDAAARHALLETEKQKNKKYDAVVILYANVPIRPKGLTDKAIEKLAKSKCDSVQSVSPTGKYHPFWMKTLVGENHDQLLMYQENHIYRRQDLPPVFILDGGIIAVTRESLLAEIKNQPHAFLGTHRLAVVNAQDAVVDIDNQSDLVKARAMMAGLGEKQKIEKIGFEIAGKWVGAEVKKKSTYILAEIGVNHDGQVDKALSLIQMAKDCGADGVKFQFFEAEKLLSKEAVLAKYQEKSGEKDVFAMLNQLQLDMEGLKKAKAKARALGLGFVVSCFSPDLMPRLAALGIDAIKFASPDLVNTPLIDAGSLLGVPMIFSTGTSDQNEQLKFIAYAKKQNSKLALLSCVSSYPVGNDQASLGQIATLKKKHAMPVGYSDHTTNVLAGMLAVAAGATLIEKHITYDTAAPGPDHGASFSRESFKKYCEMIRQAEVMMGDKAGHFLACEKEERQLSRQSICTAKDLFKGQVLKATDLTVKRPGTGIPACQFADMLGLTLTRDVSANTLLKGPDVRDARDVGGDDSKK